MRIDTQRFGTITLDQDQLFLFPGGLVGMETLRAWALLPDPDNASVAWLQSASRGDRALPLISPRAFFEGYRVQVSQRELAALHLKPGAELYVLTTIAGHSGQLTTNLRSPIVLNLNRRLGCQVITENDHPVRHPLRSLTAKPARPAAVPTSILSASQPPIRRAA
ncbi:flagellar assembly protein FliW [Roseiconus nitratireducens]|uniref:Flagellar assembly factor FliW n=1 Tax=Roseiconus nitratireducens TaxID=2605748 RepID=A0A5M6DEM4_9BACT|nr:flagellar assembly protein FliW [Roseiconus nitratireducens]KAA5544629.1 flagellar assembly protein FliW [Roseiconus nitratireducens]